MIGACLTCPLVLKVCLHDSIFDFDAEIFVYHKHICCILTCVRHMQATANRDSAATASPLVCEREKSVCPCARCGRVPEQASARPPPSLPFSHIPSPPPTRRRRAARRGHPSAGRRARGRRRAALRRQLDDRCPAGGRRGGAAVRLGWRGLARPAGMALSGRPGLPRGALPGAAIELNLVSHVACKSEGPRAAGAGLRLRHGALGAAVEASFAGSMPARAPPQPGSRPRPARSRLRGPRLRTGPHPAGPGREPECAADGTALLSVA